MTKAATVMKLIGAGTDDATALAAPGAGPLSYKQLREDWPRSSGSPRSVP